MCPDNGFMVERGSLDFESIRFGYRNLFLIPQLFRPHSLTVLVSPTCLQH